MLTCRSSDLKLRIAVSSTGSIRRCLNRVFRYGNGLVQALISAVAHMPGRPLLPPTLCARSCIVQNGLPLEGRPTRDVVRPKAERSIVFPLSGILCSLCGYRVDRSTVVGENTCAVLERGQLPNNPLIKLRIAVSSTTLPCAAGQSHVVLSPKTTERQRNRLQGRASGVQRGAPWRRVLSRASGSPRTQE